jgi:PPOX class probable F420-dependent enzyme
VRLDREPYLSLATFRRSGVAVPTPVWFARVGDKLYVFSAGDAGKVKRLRNSAKARVASCDARGNLLGEWQDAVARVVSDAARIAAAEAAMRAKYGWQVRLLDFFSGLTGRKGKRAWLEIDA